MKRLVISSAVAALIAGGAGISFAGGPGPNGHNDFGLCKAYFSGSDNGQANKAQHGAAFIALTAAAGDSDGDGTPGEPSDVRAYCDQNGQTPGGDTHGKSGH